MALLRRSRPLGDAVDVHLVLDVLTAASGPFQDPSVLLPVVGPLVAYNDLSQVAAANAQAATDSGGSFRCVRERQPVLLV